MEPIARSWVAAVEFARIIRAVTAITCKWRSEKDIGPPVGIP